MVGSLLEGILALFSEECIPDWWLHSAGAGVERGGLSVQPTPRTMLKELFGSEHQQRHAASDAIHDEYALQMFHGECHSALALWHRTVLGVVGGCSSFLDTDVKIIICFHLFIYNVDQLTSEKNSCFWSVFAFTTRHQPAIPKPQFFKHSFMTAVSHGECLPPVVMDGCIPQCSFITFTQSITTTDSRIVPKYRSFPEPRSSMHTNCYFSKGCNARPSYIWM